MLPLCDGPAPLELLAVTCGLAGRSCGRQGLWEPAKVTGRGFGLVGAGSQHRGVLAVETTIRSDGGWFAAGRRGGCLLRGESIGAGPAERVKSGEVVAKACRASGGFRAPHRGARQL